MISSRDRIRLSLNHKEADRIPIDFGGMRSTGISTISYNRLLKKLGLDKNLAKMYDFVQQLAYPSEEVLKLFDTELSQKYKKFRFELYEIEKSAVKDLEKMLGCDKK